MSALDGRNRKGAELQACRKRAAIRLELRVEIWPVARLKLEPGTRGPEWLNSLRASFAGFGIAHPALVGPDGVIIADSDGVIMSGHARLIAVKKLGRKEVEVIVVRRHYATRS